MGRAFAEEIAGLELSLQAKVGIHLKGNCYPPVPDYMVEPCVKAIEIVQSAQWGDAESNEPVELPEGVLWKGITTAPAYAFVENFRLESFIEWEE
jgi:hypothetical protein